MEIQAIDCDVPSTVSEDERRRVPTTEIEFAIPYESLGSEDVRVLVYLGVMQETTGAIAAST